MSYASLYHKSFVDGSWLPRETALLHQNLMKVIFALGTTFAAVN